MRIAIVTDYAYPLLGGIAEHVAGQAGALSDLGHEVTIVTGTPLIVPRLSQDERPAPLDERFEVIRMGTALPVYGNGTGAVVTWVAHLRRQLAAVLRSRAIDVVHTHAPYNPSLPLYAVRASLDVPVVGTFHSVFARNPVRHAFWRTVPPAIAHLDQRFAVSRACAEQLRAIFRMPFSVVANGVDTDRFRPRPERASPRSIVWVGRFDSRTGLHALTKALSRIEHRDVRLILVGDGPSRRIHQRLLSKSVREKVVFAGRRHRTLPTLLAQSTAVCCTSRRASFGMTVLEAMSCGRPVVASRISGHSELVREGENGLLVTLNDADQLAGAITLLLDDDGLESGMGVAGRRLAVDRYAWPVIASALDEAYRQATAGRQRSAVRRACGQDARG